MEENEFEGYDPTQIEEENRGPEEIIESEVIGLESEDANELEDYISGVPGLNPEDQADDKPYLVKVYHPASPKGKAIERDVTDLIRNDPDTSIVDLIKYSIKDPQNSVEEAVASTVNMYLLEFESKENYDYIAENQYLRILVLDKEKAVREFYEDFIIQKRGQTSGQCIVPTAKAMKFFEKRPKEEVCRLDLSAKIVRVGGV
ncbi:MAG: hypothetical protein ISS23_02340 [Nanoarchaeota archaeon]|nr:hypothetical protein [Nanoarchaeota archaeon]